MRIMPEVLFVLFFSWHIVTGAPAFADDTVKLKVLVTNPSDTQKQTMPVTINLPSGIKSEDVVDRGNFRIDYNFEQSLFTAYQDVVLDPGQTMTLELEMKDIWRIPSDEIDLLKAHVQQNVLALSKSSYSQQAKSLGDGITKRLEQIVAAQEQAKDSDPQEKMSALDTNTSLLKEIKKDVSVLDDLLVEINPVAAASLSKEEGGTRAEVPKPVRTDTDVKQTGVVVFEIMVSNPLDTQNSVPVKYYLPVELKRQDFIDTAGLKTAYDYEKNSYYVYNDGILLAAGESRKYSVTVKDVWGAPVNQIKMIKEHAGNLAGLMTQTEYNAMAQALEGKIVEGLDHVLNSQRNINDSVQNHIGNYRENLKRLEEVRGYVTQLDRLFVRAGGSIGESLGKDAFFPGTKGVALISKSIFRGKAPDTATSWKIILCIVGFLGAISFLFFILWWTQVRGESLRKTEKIQ